MQVPCAVGEVSKNCTDITPPNFALLFPLATGTTSSGDGKAAPLGDANRIKGLKGKSDLAAHFSPALAVSHTACFFLT